MKQRQRLRMERKRRSMLLRKAMKYIEAQLDALGERITNQIIDDYVDRCFRAVLRAEAKLNGEPIISSSDTVLLLGGKLIRNISELSK